MGEQISRIVGKQSERERTVGVMGIMSAHIELD